MEKHADTVGIYFSWCYKQIGSWFCYEPEQTRGSDDHKDAMLARTTGGGAHSRVFDPRG
jgi:hypothetical protein